MFVMLLLTIDLNQGEICHATSKSFHGSSVQTKDIMSEKLKKRGNDGHHFKMHGLKNGFPIIDGLEYANHLFVVK